MAILMQTAHARKIYVGSCLMAQHPIQDEGGDRTWFNIRRYDDDDDDDDDDNAYDLFDDCYFKCQVTYCLALYEMDFLGVNLI
jgi:hypothetical protein